MFDYKIFHNGIQIRSGYFVYDDPRMMLEDYLIENAVELRGNVSVLYRTHDDETDLPWFLSDFRVEATNTWMVVCETLQGTETLTIEQLEKHDLIMRVADRTLCVIFPSGELLKFLITMNENGLLPAVSCSFRTGVIADHKFVFKWVEVHSSEIVDR